MRARVARAIGSLVGACVMVLGCASSPPVPNTASLPGVRHISAAVAATAASRFTEINVNADGVILFVVDGATERSFLYADGQLEPPGEPQPAQGAGFSIAGIDLARGTALVTQVERQFPGATVTTVALIDVPPHGAVWALRSRSVRGGLVNLLFTRDGATISATPAT